MKKERWIVLLVVGLIGWGLWAQYRQAQQRAAINQFIGDHPDVLTR